MGEIRQILKKKKICFVFQGYTCRFKSEAFASFASIALRPCQCKIMTNIMPTHAKIRIEPGIRELFLEQYTWQRVTIPTSTSYDVPSLVMIIHRREQTRLKIPNW